MYKLYAVSQKHGNVCLLSVFSLGHWQKKILQISQIRDRFRQFVTIPDTLLKAGSNCTVKNPVKRSQHANFSPYQIVVRVYSALMRDYSLISQL